MDEHLTPAQVQQRVYERMHANRFVHIEDARRARRYQAELAAAEAAHRAAFNNGLMLGAASVAAAAIVLAILTRLI